MKVTTVSVKFSRRVDLGYKPYIEYLKALGNRPVPFGTRDNSNMETDLYISAEVDEGESAELVGAELLVRARGMIDQNMGYILGTAEAPTSEENFVIEKTEVVRVQGEF